MGINIIAWYFLIYSHAVNSFSSIDLTKYRQSQIIRSNINRKERINDRLFTTVSQSQSSQVLFMFKNDEELFADLDDGSGDDSSSIEDEEDMIENKDLSGCLIRSLKLGEDFSLTNYIGNMGFEEVTDWEYYYEEEDYTKTKDEKERVIVQPSPLDPKTPKRTRTPSGSVVRLFRGEMQGRVNSMLRSKGMDTRILIKEFSGEQALELAKAELHTISILQSNLCAETSEEARNGAWSISSSSEARYLFELIEILINDAPFAGILGTVNVTEMLSDQMTNDANTWYRALGTGPPVYNSIWVVYPYPGLSSLSNYSSKIPILRVLQQPIKKGFFGNPIAPNPLPFWEVRANYIINGIFKQSLKALSHIHDNGIVHRSIGRSSIYLSTKLLDKNIPSSPYATSTSQLSIKMTDFGFSNKVSNLSYDENFRATARAYKIEILPESNNVNYLTTTRFAIAEDLHALGYVFLGILLSVLAEPDVDIGSKTLKSTLPPTDEETLQRLLTDIFDKDIKQFRSYIQNEEGNIYTKLIELLDDKDGAGWDLLDTMCFARERSYEKKNDLVILTASGLLSSPFFQN